MATVLVEVRLFDPARAEPVDVIDEIDPESADNQDFMWTEGNYACDCNKRLFIARARKEKEPELNPCGDSIRLERLAVGGEVIIWAPRATCAN